MSGRPWFWHTAMFETTSRVRIMDAQCVSLHVSTLSLLKIHLHLCQKLWMLPVSLLHCLFPSFSLPSSTKILRSQFLHFLHLFSNWVFISMIFFELRQNIEIFQCFDFIKNTIQLTWETPSVPMKLKNHNAMKVVSCFEMNVFQTNLTCSISI